MTVHRCPDCRCADETVPQPTTSSEWVRKAAREAAAAAVKASKEKRNAGYGGQR